MEGNGHKQSQGTSSNDADLIFMEYFSLRTTTVEIMPTCQLRWNVLLEIGHHCICMCPGTTWCQTISRLIANLDTITFLQIRFRWPKACGGLLRLKWATKVGEILRYMELSLKMSMKLFLSVINWKENTYITLQKWSVGLLITMISRYTITIHVSVTPKRPWTVSLGWCSRCIQIVCCAAGDQLWVAELAN